MTLANSTSTEWQEIQFHEESGVQLRFLFTKEFNLELGTWTFLVGNLRETDAPGYVYDFSVTIDQSKNQVMFMVASADLHPVLSMVDDIPYGRTTPKAWQEWILHQLANEFKSYLDTHNHDQTLKHSSLG